MKQIIIFFLLICSMFLNAQETVELDGKKITKKELSFSVPYFISSVNQILKSSCVKNGTLKKNEKIKDQQIFTSRSQNSFAQQTKIERSDSAIYYLPNSEFKFFDENGKEKWTKLFKGGTAGRVRLSEDGNYCIMEYFQLSDDLTGSKQSMKVFDEDGNIVCITDKPTNIRVSSSGDLICYQHIAWQTNSSDDEKTVFCYDLLSNKKWSKTLPMSAEIEAKSSNGNFIGIYSDKSYTLCTRDGNILFIKSISDFGGGLGPVSNDGKYALCIRSSSIDTSYFDVFNLATMKSTRTYYLNVENEAKGKMLYNGGCFVENTKYIIAMTAIIDSGKAMIIFHDLEGNYLGHQVYNNIESSFWNPSIVLLKDGSFKVIMDGFDLGLIVLSDVNTLKYLNK
ncbi:MAG: hypothetical protein ACERKD_05745 [Prolixibacteraceae bacterium]